MSTTLRIACASFWPCTGSPLGHLLGLRQRLLRVLMGESVRIAVLHRAQWLLHWIEGPPPAVDKAWQRIQRMPELEASRLLHRSLGPQTLREALHIAAVVRQERPEQVARAMARLAELPAPGPHEIWRALAAPGGTPPCGSIVLASARGHDDVDLLQRLVERHGGEIVYRRFAGADPAQFDCGAAYADFPTGNGRRVRLHVLSRRCLRNELVLGELTKLRELVLLLGARPTPCRQLAEAAVDLLRGRASRTRIHLLASDPASLARVEGLLAASGLDATVLPRTLQAGAEEADHLDATLAA